MAIFESPWGPGGASVSTADLGERLGDPGLVVVDVRSMAAYNGWRLHGEARGGHLPRGRRVPARVAEQARGRRGREAAEREGRHHRSDDRRVWRWCGRRRRPCPNAGTAWLRGRAGLRGGLPGLGCRWGLPVERLPNYHKLGHPAWLLG